MGLGGSLALPVGRGSCRAVTLPWILRTVLIRRGVVAEGVIKCLTVRHLVFSAKLPTVG